jgi:hypothetical protein
VISKKWRDRRGQREVDGLCLMGDAPFACLLMSLSLMGHHDQRQESSKKLFKPINDYLPFIFIKVKKVQRILHQPRLECIGKWLFFLIDVTETFFSDITPMELDTFYF